MIEDDEHRPIGPSLLQENQGVRVSIDRLATGRTHNRRGENRSKEKDNAGDIVEFSTGKLGKLVSRGPRDILKRSASVVVSLCVCGGDESPSEMIGGAMRRGTMTRQKDV